MNSQWLSLLRRLMFLVVVMLLCSVLRCILFMWKPLTGEYSPHIFYPWFFYAVPEILPSCPMLLLMTPSLQSQVRRQTSANAAVVGDHRMSTPSTTTPPEHAKAVGEAIQLQG